MTKLNKSPISHYSRMKRSAGTTLLEMLITLLILSVGMFAISRMLTQSIALLNNGLQQQRAALAINNLAEILQGVPEDVLRTRPAAANHSCAGTHPCSPHEFFAHSVYRWTTLLARNLPAGQGELQIIETDEQDMLQLSVTWRSGNNQLGRRESVVPISSISGYAPTQP